MGADTALANTANGMPIEPSATDFLMDSSVFLISSPLLLGASSALVAGLTGSLHCGLMCGPLAGAAMGGSGPKGRLALAWHLGRIGAYTLVGLLLGLASQALSLAISFSVQPYLPWVMALGLIVTAFDLGNRLRPLPGVAQISRGLARASGRWPPWARAAALGAATPFLPCGLLYGIFLAALATNSAAGGALVMAAFSLGAIPLLVAVQLGARSLDRWPTAALVLRRVVPLVAAVILIFRAVLAQQSAAQCH